MARNLQLPGVSDTGFWIARNSMKGHWEAARDHNDPFCLKGCLWWLLVSESRLVHHLDLRRLMDAPACNDLTGGTSTATERRVQFLESMGKSAGMGDMATGTGGDGTASPWLRDSVALSWP